MAYTTDPVTRRIKNTSRKHCANVSYMTCPHCKHVINVNINDSIFWADHIDCKHECKFARIISEFAFMDGLKLNYMRNEIWDAIGIQLRKDIIEFSKEIHTVKQFETFTHKIYKQYNMRNVIMLSEF